MAIKDNILSEKEIARFVSREGCFDLQFRKDIKHNRINKPVYYYWKAQFVLTGNYKDENLLRAIQTSLACGRLHFVGQNKIRYSVQDINSLYKKIVPFFKENSLFGKKKKDFDFWQKAIEILFQNKGQAFKCWPKDAFQSLIDLQKSMQQYKLKKASAKWLSVAEDMLKTTHKGHF